MADDRKMAKRFYTHVIRPMDAIYTQMELEGWPVDVRRVARLQEWVDEEQDGIEGQMLDYLDDRNIDADTDSLRSPAKLGPILFDHLKYPMHPDKRVAFTKNGQPSTSGDALFHLRGRDFVDLLFKLRSLDKTEGTYLIPMMEMGTRRGRIGTSYKLTGTRTGRTASGAEDAEGTHKSDSGTNLQNLPYNRIGPEGWGVRHAIRTVGDEKDWLIMEADFSQIELRVAGMLSGDPLFLKAYREDQDIHAIRAMRVAGYTPAQWKELPKEQQKALRQKAKAINFGFLYGMSAHTFQVYALASYGVEFTMQECQDIRRQFFADHSGLQPWYNRQEEEALEKGYITSLTGRRRHLLNARLDSDGGKELRSRKQSAIRMAINTPVQGFASDLKLMSMVTINSLLDRKWAYLFGEIHDSILICFQRDCLDDVAHTVLKVMEHPPIVDKLGIELTVPIKAEIKYGRSLGEVKEYKLAA